MACWTKKISVASRPQAMQPMARPEYDVQDDHSKQIASKPLSHVCINRLTVQSRRSGPNHLDCTILNIRRTSHPPKTGSGPRVLYCTRQDIHGASTTTSKDLSPRGALPEKGDKVQSSLGGGAVGARLEIGGGCHMCNGSRQR